MSEKTPEERMRRLRDEDLWTTDAPRVRARVVSPRMQALHWAVTVVVVGALAAGALSGIAAFRSARQQFAADQGISRSELVGSWSLPDDGGASLTISAPFAPDSYADAADLGPSTALGFDYSGPCDASGALIALGSSIRFQTAKSSTGECASSAAWWSRATVVERDGATSFAFVDASGAVLERIVPAGAPPSTTESPNPSLSPAPNLSRVTDAQLDRQVALPSDATPVSDLEGIWTTAEHHSTTLLVRFDRDSWGMAEFCPGQIEVPGVDNPWLKDSRGHWTAGAVGEVVGGVGRTCGTTGPPLGQTPVTRLPASWITHAYAVGMVGDELTFYGSDGVRLGALVRVDDGSSPDAPATVEPGSFTANDIIGLWHGEGEQWGSYAVWFHASDWVSDGACTFTEGEWSVAADGAWTDVPRGLDPFCLLTVPDGSMQPAQAVDQAKSVTLVDDRLSFLDEDGKVLGTLVRVRTAPVSTRTPSSSAGTASPLSSADLLGQWNEGAGSGSQTLTLSDGTWETNHGCGQVAGTWSISADGTWAGDGNGLSYDCYTSAPGVNEWVTGAARVSLVDGVLTFYKADGSELGVLVRLGSPAPAGDPTAQISVPTPEYIVGTWTRTDYLTEDEVEFGADGRWTGPGACNSHSGTWTLSRGGSWSAVSDDTSELDCLRFGPDGKAAGEESAWVLNAASVRLVGGALTFYAADGSMLGSLQRK